METSTIDPFLPKIGIYPIVSVENNTDLSLAYTPGVARPCLKIKENPDLSFAYTCRGNMVAVVSDGTRVLGLGDIGPEAALPVMEGKALLFRRFAGIDAVPICLKTKDSDEIVRIVQALEPSFAGINLEDFSSPKCYAIENELRQTMKIPVFHDDQHGTAIACCSALIGALRFTGKDLCTAKLVVNGAGAAGTAIAALLLDLGAQNVILLNSKGTIFAGQQGLNEVQTALAAKLRTNRQIPFTEAAENADALLGVSSSGTFTADIIRNMNERAIVFAMANPEPECRYEDAKAAGAAVAATGRSDAPNQVNNVKVFPGLFRGALAVRATSINRDMMRAAVYALADLIEPDKLAADYVTPDTFDPRIAPAVAAAVADAAMKSGAARTRASLEEIKNSIAAAIKKGTAR